MANEAGEILIAGSGSISVAPVGTTLPTSPTASLNAAFVELGYVTEDGVTLTVEPQVDEYMAWQSRQAVRRELTSQAISVAFELEQFNPDTISLAFGGGEVTTTGGVSRFDFVSDGDVLDERSLVVDWSDGASRNYRAVFERGNVTDNVETKLSRTGLATLPITFSVLDALDGGAPGYILTDDEAFDTGAGGGI